MQSAAPPRFMNQKLLEFFPTRTLEALKGRRKRQDYRDLVATKLNTVEIPEEEEPQLPNQESDELDIRLLDYLESLRESGTQEFKANQLHNIVQQARTAGKAATLRSLSLYLREIFPVPRKKAAKKHNKAPLMENKRKTRKRAYAVTQELWKKDRRRCVTNILSDLGTVSHPPRDIMEPYWSALMTANSDRSPTSRRSDSKNELWMPISQEDLKWGRLSKTSAEIGRAHV